MPKFTQTPTAKDAVSARTSTRLKRASVLTTYATSTSKATSSKTSSSKSRTTTSKKRKDPPAPCYSSSSDEPAILTPHGLPPVETTVANHWVYLFFRFCAERHRMYNKRQEGVPRGELSDDETLTKTFVGNIFRELDGGSKRMKDEVIGVGVQSHEEICFRVFLFCGFYNDSTWRYLVDKLGGAPSWKDFSLTTYEKLLHQRWIVEKQKIYYGGFQNVPPTKYFGKSTPLPHYAATLRFVMSLMEMGMPEQLLKCQYASDASAILQTAPTIGGFMSLNLLCDLNDSPFLHFYYRNFASCGPGSRGFLQRIFGGKTVINSVAMEEAALRWLFENQWRYWARLKEDPPHAWQLGLRPGMRVLDIENSLCWCHRYINDYQSKGFKNLAQIPHPIYDPSVTEKASAPAWCDELSQVRNASKATWNGDYDEEKQKLESIKEKGEDVYEVEKIVCRKGSRKDKNALLRVRWKGYTPEEDTWERASSLKDGADEALNEWFEWESKVWNTIDRIANENPYKGPVEDIKQEIDENGASVLPDRSDEADNSRVKRRRTSTTPATASISFSTPAFTSESSRIIEANTIDADVDIAATAVQIESEIKLEHERGFGTFGIRPRDSILVQV